VDVDLPAKSKPVQPASFQPPAADQAKPIKTAPLIEKGGSLTVHARTAGVRITAAGKAMDSGSMDEAIGVELIDTKQKVIGRIIGPQTVEITTDMNSRK
jgi:flagella basal body P-ring formation protein FlgA